jgi:hypothetical protein
MDPVVHLTTLLTHSCILQSVPLIYVAHPGRLCTQLLLHVTAKTKRRFRNVVKISRAAALEELHWEIATGFNPSELGTNLLTCRMG